MLIAAGEIPHRLHRRRRFDMQRVDIASDDRIVARLFQKAEFRGQLGINQRDVVLYRQTVHDSLALAFLRQQSDAIPDRIDRGAHGKLLSLQNNLPAAQLVSRENCTQNLRSTGADQTRKSDDLALA